MIITKRNETYLIKNNEYYDVYVDDVLVPKNSVRQSSDAPQNIYKKEERSRVSGYRDISENVLISVDHYKELKSELEEPDDDGDFSSLDNEFAWRKFNERYRAEYEKYETQTPIEFSILYVTDSAFSDINSYYSLHKPLDQNVAEFEYIPDIVGYMYEIAEKYDLTVIEEKDKYKVNQRGKNQLVLGNHTLTWEFAKVNGNYIDSSSSAQNKRWKQSWRGSYDGLVTKRQQIYAEVELAIKRQLPQKAKLNEMQVQDALKIVTKMKYNLNSVQSYQKTRSSLTHARNNVKELEDFLNTILEQS